MNSLPATKRTFPTRSLSLPEPPEHLSDEAKAWWQELCAEFDFATCDLKRLQCAAESWDRAQEARAILAREGITYTDENGKPRKHPAVGVERDARTQFLRALRELGVDVEGPSAPPINPMRGRRG
jgi:P27 family predicted phage terminase small subunit